MEESLRLFSDMRRGLMDEGSATLRCYTCCCQDGVTAALRSTIAPVATCYRLCHHNRNVSCKVCPFIGHQTAQSNVQSACMRQWRGNSGFVHSDRALHAG